MFDLGRGINQSYQGRSQQQQQQDGVYNNTANQIDRFTGSLIVAAEIQLNSQ